MIYKTYCTIITNDIQVKKKTDGHKNIKYQKVGNGHANSHLVRFKRPFHTGKIAPLLIL